MFKTKNKNQTELSKPRHILEFFLNFINEKSVPQECSQEKARKKEGRREEKSQAGIWLVQ